MPGGPQQDPLGAWRGPEAHTALRQQGSGGLRGQAGDQGWSWQPLGQRGMGAWGPRLRPSSAPPRSRWPTASAPGGSTSAGSAPCAGRVWRRSASAAKVQPASRVAPPQEPGLCGPGGPAPPCGQAAGLGWEAGRWVRGVAGPLPACRGGLGGETQRSWFPSCRGRGWGSGAFLSLTTGPQMFRKVRSGEGQTQARSGGGQGRCAATRGPLTLPAPQCVSCTFTPTVCPSPAATAASATRTGTANT